MKRIVRNSIIVTALSILLCVALLGCMPKEADGIQGTYNFVRENMAVISNTTYNYQFILDGFGTGDYIHKGSTHKVKYEYNPVDRSITIKDTITGIKYSGTLSESGELHVYDGNPNGTLVSEFFYQKQ